MLTLKEWMELIDYKITEGDSYGWTCYGDHAHSLSMWNGVHGKGGFSSNIVFDTQTQEVYEVDFCDYTNDRAYRIINPDFKKEYESEAKERGSFANEAWDCVEYIDLEVDDDFIQKALAIKAGEDYDTRVSVPLELSDDDLLKYMTMAHERDITFNQFVEEALRHAIEEYNRDPEGTKARAQEWKARAQETSDF